MDKSEYLPCINANLREINPSPTSCRAKAIISTVYYSSMKLRVEKYGKQYSILEVDTSLEEFYISKQNLI